MGLLGTLLLTLLGGSASPSGSETPTVSAFNCKTGSPTRLASLREVQTAYGRHSVDIFQVALSGNTAELSKSVSPDAEFEVYEGDAGTGPRTKGPVAAVEFAKQIAPVSYRFTSGSLAPISTDPCGKQSVELVLQNAQPDRITVAKFTFKDGILIDIGGEQVELIAGEFQQSN